MVVGAPNKVMSAKASVAQSLLLGTFIFPSTQILTLYWNTDEFKYSISIGVSTWSRHLLIFELNIKQVTVWKETQKSLFNIWLEIPPKSLRYTTLTAIHLFHYRLLILHNKQCKQFWEEIFLLISTWIVCKIDNSFY